jgi:hypothetical protein
VTTNDHLFGGSGGIGLMPWPTVKIEQRMLLYF